MVQDLTRNPSSCVLERVGIFGETSPHSFSIQALWATDHKLTIRILFFFVGESLNSKIVTTKTVNKKGPSEEVQEIMKKRLALEYNFYNFVKDRFHRIKYELN